MTAVEQRASSLEGRLDALATRADLASEISRLEVKVERMTWTMLAGMVTVGGLVVAVLRLWQ